MVFPWWLLVEIRIYDLFVEWRESILKPQTQDVTGENSYPAVGCESLSQILTEGGEAK